MLVQSYFNCTIHLRQDLKRWGENDYAVPWLLAFPFFSLWLKRIVRIYTQTLCMVFHLRNSAWQINWLYWFLQVILYCSGIILIHLCSTFLTLSKVDVYSRIWMDKGLSQIKKWLGQHRDLVSLLHILWQVRGQKRNNFKWEFQFFIQDKFNIFNIFSLRYCKHTLKIFKKLRNVESVNESSILEAISENV